jgi:hypothetical protein
MPGRSRHLALQIVLRTVFGLAVAVVTFALTGNLVAAVVALFAAGVVLNAFHPPAPRSTAR